ncbi:MAG: PepSY domain-containing protein [Allosphingosinicella sp.]
MRHSILAAVVTAALAASPLLAKPQGARITMAAARAKALKVVPQGRIKSAELEREHGRLIYSFDIAAPGKTGIEEVQISAVDGSLVSVEHESPAKERREARDEARPHIK